MKYIARQSLSQYLSSVFFMAGVAIFGQITMADEVAIPASSPALVDPHPDSLVLRVSGSSAGITTDYFEESVADALIAKGLFPAIEKSTSADDVLPMIRAKSVFPATVKIDNASYFLDIRVTKVETPSFSARMTVGMNTIWALYRVPENVELMHERIDSTYTGGVFEGGIHGANRVRVAMEGATRENIRIGIEKLASLELREEK